MWKRRQQSQEQYTSLLTGLQAVGQVKGWKVPQIVFMGGTCGSVHVESFNENMKALAHRRVGREVKGGKGFMSRVRNMSTGTCIREEGANSVRGPKLNDQIVPYAATWHHIEWKDNVHKSTCVRCSDVCKVGLYLNDPYCGCRQCIL